MGNPPLKRISVSILLLASALLAGCATGPTQTRIPRPGSAVERPPRPAETQPLPPAEPEAQTMPLERGEVLRPQPLPQPELLPLPQGSPGMEEEAAVETEAAPRSGNPVVVSLLAQADELAASGQLDRAAASVERGLRIAPKDASLWQKLARIRLEQGQYHQAESLAKKSIALARGRAGMIADNWKIIAQARRDAGDAAGARRALEKMLQYSGGMTR